MIEGYITFLGTELTRDRFLNWPGQGQTVGEVKVWAVGRFRADGFRVAKSDAMLCSYWAFERFIG